MYTRRHVKVTVVIPSSHTTALSPQYKIHRPSLKPDQFLKHQRNTVSTAPQIKHDVEKQNVSTRLGFSAEVLFGVQNLVEGVGKLQDEGQATNRLGSQARGETGRVRRSRLSMARSKVAVAREGGRHREMDLPRVFTGKLWCRDSRSEQSINTSTKSRRSPTVHS